MMCPAQQLIDAMPSVNDSNHHCSCCENLYFDYSKEDCVAKPDQYQEKGAGQIGDPMKGLPCMFHNHNVIQHTEYGWVNGVFKGNAPG